MHFLQIAKNLSLVLPIKELLENMPKKENNIENNKHATDFFNKFRKHLQK